MRLLCLRCESFRHHWSWTALPYHSVDCVKVPHNPKKQRVIAPIWCSLPSMPGWRNKANHKIKEPQYHCHDVKVANFISTCLTCLIFNSLSFNLSRRRSTRPNRLSVYLNWLILFFQVVCQDTWKCHSTQFSAKKIRNPYFYHIALQGE
jgi:hypothetical protein